MNKIKVLYVEDEPFLGRIVKESLESRNFEVNMLSDGKLAVQSFQEQQPDICVLDIMLPSKDGYAIAKEIRNINPAVPIIFVTAKTQTDDVLKGFETGGNDYLRKPFSMEELIVRMNNLVRLAQKTPGNHTENIAIGKYVFSPSKYELRLGDKLKKLSHKEASLLQVLANNINGTTERKLILQQVWGDDSFFNSRNLDVYITKLRDYLKDDPDIEIITMKGLGYRFSVSSS
ncbi:MAG TPA: response regulator transcription factor [Cyclobacteriaceae bacterium]|nr:response regulator transcription factor [Cyclobacteriaceae bacterium]